MRGAKPRPLARRVVLVVGADDSATRRTALHVAAQGARLVVTGSDAPEVLITAGLVAASGGTARVLDARPDLDADALLAAAARELAPVTDALVAGTSPGAESLARALVGALGAGAIVRAVPPRPPQGERAFAQATCAAFEEEATRSDSGPAARSDTLDAP